MLLVFSMGPGGFRELREACRNDFHLSGYLSDEHSRNTVKDKTPSKIRFLSFGLRLTDLSLLDLKHKGGRSSP